MRVANREELVALLGRTRGRDTAELLEPSSPRASRLRRSHDVGDAARHPQTEALGILQPLEHEGNAELMLPALPLSFDGERATFRTAPPAVGAHTEEISLEVGYSADEIAALEADGVIRVYS